MITENDSPVFKLTDMLCRFLQMAMSATVSAQGAICLKEPESGGTSLTEGVVMSRGGACKPSQRLLIQQCPACVAFFEGDRNEPLMTTDLSEEALCARCASPSRSNLVIPVRYQGASLGIMVLAASSPNHYTASQLDVCRWIATEIAYHSKRYELSETMKSVFGRDLMLVGTSDALRRVDEFIERASRANLPALILGEFGSEKSHVAYALHFGGRRDYPFVEVKCATLNPSTLKRTLSDELRRADGGTIFFNGIDELGYHAQCQLSDLIESEIGEWTNRPYQSGPVQVRLIASARRDLDEPAQDPGSCGPLVEKFDFLLTQVAPLRDRKEDIKPLMEYFLYKHGTQTNRSFSREAEEAFKAYDWPGNVYEIERVVARLAVMSEEEVIGIQNVLDYVPNMAKKLRRLHRQPVVGRPAHTATPEEQAEPKSQVDKRAVRLALGLMKADFAEIQNFHPGLQNALKYIAQNLHEAITRQELSRQSGLSASHLAYLFQRTLGASFKSFLAIARIEEAKQLLIAKPYMSITEISFQVGFGDLRHFERTFKRVVGLPAKQFRNLALRSEESDSDS